MRQNESIRLFNLPLTYGVSTKGQDLVTTITAMLRECPFFPLNNKPFALHALHKTTAKTAPINSHVD
jgi:hypothetical protein